MSEASQPLSGYRVLAVINGVELFGHERGNIEVLEALREQGAEVIVGVNATDGGGAVGAALRRLDFETFALPFSNQWSWQWLRRHPWSIFEKTGAVIRCTRTFQAVIRQFRPTHIHLGSPLVYSYVAPALAMSQVPLVYRMGDCPPIDSPVNLRIWRMAMRRSSRVVANSRYVADSVRSAGVREVSVIYNCAPGRRGTRGAKNDEPVPGRAPRLAYVGAVAEHKGLVPLVEAIALLRAEFVGLNLDLVGSSRYDGDFRARLQELVAERGLTGSVRFHGFVDDPEPLLHRAAVHVAPSLSEEPGANAVLEAKRAGTPSVVFPSGGLPEMVRHGVDGYICREKSVDALVEALRWMLSDRVRLKAMGRAAREDEEARFGKARFAQEWAAIYRQAIECR